MTCYETYDSPTSKRKGQRSGNVKRGRPTGLSDDFLIVLTENGTNGTGMVDAIASVYGNGSTALAGTGVSRDYLRTHCRRVGRKRLPAKWVATFDAYLT